MMKQFCMVCGDITKYKIQAADGMICSACASLTPSYRTETIDTLRIYRREQQKRASIFQKTSELKQFMTVPIVIDENNKLFCLGQDGLKISKYYYFDEVESYTIEQQGGKQITKSKGGIGRAVVGGALFGVAGAVVGANTSKKETKTVGGTSVLKIDFNSFFGKCTESIVNYPLGISAFLDKCIKLNENTVTTNISEADEILKFKKLLDEGIITQEEFEMKKKQLLNL